MKNLRSQEWSCTSVRHACLTGASVLALVAAAAPALAGAEAITTNAAATTRDTASPQDAASSPPSATDASAKEKKETAGNTVKEVVVTGIRGSLESAAQIKRKASTFVDSITASDVSALPDTSVSEALGRIAGVSVTRYQYGGSSPDFPAAEGSGNLIRGLSWVRSEFNGRDEFSASGGRALDWSSVPPELVGGVDVYKNSSAELIEGGIGGTINLRTLEPFDRKGFYAAVSGDETYATLRDKWSPSYSGVISNRWSTPIGQFGLMGSYSTSKLSSLINDWQQGAPTPRTTASTPEPNTFGSQRFNGVDPSNIIAIDPIFQLRQPRIDRERTSYYLAAQWKDADTEATFKYVRVKNHTSTVEHTIEHLTDWSDSTKSTVSDLKLTPFKANVPLCSSGDSRTDVYDSTGKIFETPANDCNTMIPVGGGMMQSGVISSEADAGVGPDGYAVNTLSRGVVDDALTEDFSLNVKRRLTDRLRLNFDVQYTTASAQNTELWSVFQTHLNVFEKIGLNNPVVKFYEPTTGMCPSGQNGALAPCKNTFNSQYLLPQTDSQGNITSYLEAYPHAVTNTADPWGYYWLAAYDHEHQGTGDLGAARLDLAYDFDDNSWFKTLKFGARYSERSQVDDSNQGNWASVAPTWQAGHVALMGAFPAGTTVVDDYKNFYGGNVVQGANTQFVYMSPKYLLNYNAFQSLFHNNPLTAGAGWQPRSTLYGVNDISDIKEKTTNLYLQLDFQHELGGGQSLQGNIGVRYTNTDMASSGWYQFHPFSAPGACTPGTASDGTITTVYACSHRVPQDFLPQTAAYIAQNAVKLVANKSDNHLLPAFNMKWNLNSDMLIRFAVSEGMTRPNISDLKAAQTVGANTTTVNWPVGAYPQGTYNGVQGVTLNYLGLTGGNPDLKPTTATNYDLSYEWYFKGGMLSVAGFYKDLSNIIAYGTRNMGKVTLDGTTVPIIYSGQVNVSSATVKGAEFQYQQFFDKLPGLLSHLGFQGNVSYIDAQVQGAQQGCTNAGGDPCRFGINDLYGQSKYMLNAVAMYQDGTFEGRVAYDWRSKYLVSYGDYMTGDPVYNEAAGFMDASFKYNFDRHLQFRFLMENLLDTKNKAEIVINNQRQMFDRYSVINDRRFILGVRYQY